MHLCSFDFTTLPEGNPRFMPELHDWCVETFGYAPGIVWRDEIGLLFETDRDLVLYRISHATTQIVWTEFLPMEG